MADLSLDTVCPKISDLVWIKCPILVHPVHKGQTENVSKIHFPTFMGLLQGRKGKGVGSIPKYPVIRGLQRKLMKFHNISRDPIFAS